MSSYNFKVVLLGQGCVGKTSLVLRYVSNVFNDSHQSTMQASFLKKQLYLDKDLVKLNIWDTAGQERFHALGPIYYRESHGALLVYDVTNPSSFQKVRDWVKELNKMLGTDNIRLAIVGNKIDLLLNSSGANSGVNAHALLAELSTANNLLSSKQQHQQQQPHLALIHNHSLIQEAMQFTDELINAKHYLISAKLNHGIGELFISLSQRMIEQSNKLKQARESKRIRSSVGRQLDLVSDDDDDDDDDDDGGGGDADSRDARRRRTRVNLGANQFENSRKSSCC